MTNLSPLSLSDERIIAIKKAARCMDPAKPWGDTLAFARDLIAALSQEADSTAPASDLRAAFEKWSLDGRWINEIPRDDADPTKYTHMAEMEWEAFQAGATLSSTAPVASEPTLPVEIYGKFYDVPIAVQVHIVALESKLAAPQTPSPVAPESESKVPALMDGMFLVPCAVMKNPEHPQQGWLFIPHADAKWVSLCKLPEFSAQVINYWLNEPNDGG